MPKQSGGGREEDLYRVAADLFNRYGYASTSVRQICNVLGIRESSLYNYVRCKEDLLYNICERGLMQGLEKMRPLLRMPLPPDKRLKKMIGAHLRIISGTTNEQSTMLKELRSLNPENKQKIVELRDEYQGLFRKAVEDCIREGFLPKGKGNIVTLGLMGMMNWLIHWYSPEGQMTVDSIGGVFGDLLLKERPVHRTRKDGALGSVSCCLPMAPDTRRRSERTERTRNG